MDVLVFPGNQVQTSRLESWYAMKDNINKSDSLKCIHSATYRAILVVPLPQRDRREAQQLAFSMHVLHVYYDKNV